MEQIAELFLMILMGYIIVKTGLLKGEDSKVISKIVLYLVIPCVIINAFQVDYTSEKEKELLLPSTALKRKYQKETLSLFSPDNGIATNLSPI